MKTTPITANSFQLTRMKLVNCYLVRESDGFTLVDTGLAGSGDDIVSAARELGGEIRRILLTHAHVDHVGSVDELMAKVSGVELAASARSLPLLQRPPNKSLEVGEPGGEIKGGLPGIAARPTHLVGEGELYGSLRCVETPGHIPGHLSFLDERDGTLFAGDALVGVGHLTVTGFAPWFFPLPNGGTWNKTVAVESARKLLGCRWNGLPVGMARFGVVELLRCGLLLLRLRFRSGLGVGGCTHIRIDVWGTRLVCLA